tara:strand:+ start:366 stop:1451 length:1086 start_codon:yes stop_codon:yes gene_type:complete
MALTKVDPSVVDDQVFGRRNFVINGAMQVAQRTTSQTGILQSGYYSVDRMRHAGSSLATARFTSAQVTDAPTGFVYSFKNTVTTAEGAVNADDNFYPLNYRIEARDLKRLGFATSSAQQITVSFYVKSSVTGTYVLGLYLPDSQRAQGRTYTISSADTWEYKTLTYAAGTTVSDYINLDNGTGLDMYFAGGSGSQFTTGTLPQTWSAYANADFLAGQTAQLQNTVNSTWQITGLQVEAGAIATPFEHLTFAEDLALCERYYQVLQNPCPRGVIASTGNPVACNRMATPLKTEMRANPTVALAGTFNVYDGLSTGSISNVNATYSSTSALEFDSTAGVSSSAGRACCVYNSGSYKATVDAEL